MRSNGSDEDVSSSGSGDHTSDVPSQDPSSPVGNSNGMAKQPIRSTGQQINDQTFEELDLAPEFVQEVQRTWTTFMTVSESREAAGEAIYSAVFESAPSLQSLFRTPRAVMAMRFMNGLNQIVMSLDKPADLKIVVETLGFQHLDLEVTIPRVVIFRDAIIDCLQVEMGSQFTANAREGWASTLNYVGGAYIFIRCMYTERLKILASSWATANNKKADLDLEGEANGHQLTSAEFKDSQKEEEEQASNSENILDNGLEKADKQEAKKKSRWSWRKSADADVSDRAANGVKDLGLDKEETNGNGMAQNTQVPTTYEDMFMFNAAVMGFGKSLWMQEVLASFDTIVTHVSNSYRLQEECDILSLRIAKFKGVQINFPEYKAVMLASLRSLVPKDWDSNHEVAWSWLWENVERMLKSLLGKPAQQERGLERFWMSMDDAQQALFRREVYVQFFALAPAGQDYFKQSTTRLHFIADRLVSMTLEIYKDPKKMVEDISALGLRHVGYGIPTELFGPFVTACVKVVRDLTDNEVAEEAFRWSLSLISRILVRVINEGSTIVMKAINTNSGKALRKAVSCAPRGKRALWMLNIQVGTQSISPLIWAIETGSQEAAKEIILDLLTIRADRDRYYYGMETLFSRHPDIVRRLAADSPQLLPTLLDGLIWRCRTQEKGLRRVNYYVKHLLLDPEGEYNKATEWVMDMWDPKIICHPVIVVVTDLVWIRCAFRTFLYSKSWFLFTLLVFITAQSVLKYVAADTGDSVSTQRIAVFACRCFIYIFSMGQWIYFHVQHSYRDVRDDRTFRMCHIPLPRYLIENWQDTASLLLTILLIMMFALEPILYCLQHHEGNFENAGYFTDNCHQAAGLKFPYSVSSMCAMLLYFLLLIDLSVFSTKISAFVLVCFRVLSEVGLYLFVLGFFILAFSSAISALDQENDDFAGIPPSAVALLEVSLSMFSEKRFREVKHDPALLAAVLTYIILTVVFLFNMLIAQLHSSYESTFADMLGYARLNRSKIVVEAMPSVPHSRWERFVTTLAMDQPIEFGEGDVGVAGGIQVLEPAGEAISRDTILRFGGSTSPAALWPNDENEANTEEDGFDRIEKVLDKAIKRMSRTTKDGGGDGSKAQHTDSGSGSGGGGHDSGDDSGSA